MNEKLIKFGTAPVFFTAISTILGAVLFLRFGFATGTLGFTGVIIIIILGHLVTIPTALAISEIATNKRVEGGGEYFVISRSFGMNIGATIGIFLYLSQAISIAFYVIAFTETFQFLCDFLLNKYNFVLPRQAISVPVMILLSMLILRKGANTGVKTLYLVVGLLALSMVMFFLGAPDYSQQPGFSFAEVSKLKNTDQLFYIFAIVFPAFTGMTAGVGLSGDLKNPSRSIPIGTIGATIMGMILYFFVAYKLTISASPGDLVNNQLVMSKIALWGVIIIPIGLAASTISSALGSVMVAPRTLQALAKDESVPFRKVNSWLGESRERDNEPVNASLITCIIAFVFVSAGTIDTVARVISLFFMITYGSLCLISFLNHFGASPSYRPKFSSKWYISLTGFVTSVWVMFKIDFVYSVVALSMMVLLYLIISNYHKDRNGVSSIFANAIFQINRNLQIYLQKNKVINTSNDWKPSVICITSDSFIRDKAFKLTKWISYKYGFGTYLHRINGYFSKETREQSKEVKNKLIQTYGREGHVFIDILICPSYTSAIAQAIQIPGISGMENNMLLFEFDKEKPDGLGDIIDNVRLVNSGSFDVCILASSRRQINHRNGIHVWIKTTDEENSNLMIILSFILLGHPDWKGADIKIFLTAKKSEEEAVKERMNHLIEKGRLPITSQSVKIIPEESSFNKSIVNKHSSDAGLTIIGFRSESLKYLGTDVFGGYEEIGDILFVNSYKTKEIE